jgi:glycosyltransferase involved in cell wall biosynthesis
MSAVLVIAMDRFQARTTVLGPALGGEAHHLRDVRFGKHVWLLPLRYLADSIRMWRLLRRHRPSAVVAISPGIIAPVVAWLWCLTHPCRFAVDCHTGAFHHWKWRWALPLHRLLFNRAAAVLLHIEEDAARVRRWGQPALLLPDDVPDPAEAATVERSPRPRVVVAGSFDSNEPVATVLAAAALLPDVEVRLTGDATRLAAAVRSRAPANAVLTGFLPYAQFLGELRAADLVGVFSTDPRIMNRSAFEAVGLGRPLLLSDLPGLRTRFGSGARFARNEPAAMAAAIRQALDEKEMLAERSRLLGLRLRAQREDAMQQLRTLLGTPAAVLQPA